MKIILGKSVVSLLDPPNEGTVVEGEWEWSIKRNGYGLIVLRINGRAHPDFYDGKDMVDFCHWINCHAQ